VQRIEAWAQSHQVEVRCVLDPGADDEIVRVVAAAGTPCTVVTSDRELAGRVRALGADVRGAGAFRREVDG
jgi:rRNA-processing protein FCF1